MDLRDIYVTHYDRERLRTLLEAEMEIGHSDRQALEMLRNELERAHIVDAAAIPSDVVTMDSRIRLTDVDTNEVFIYTVVFPSEANVARRKISVLAPIGTALLGYQVGDAVEWPVPGGVRKLRIEEILYQPEAAANSPRASVY
ncbi:MAG TPA: nucleoside diphosphate kinase regulator [Nitrospirales bacterium]|nr:nucleoside diphosphate kinase regulator [Nitrospirales bacterium]